jgi:hypothetical protein
MNDDFSIDPALESLAARLSAVRPKLSDREAQELLYQCAFAVGQKWATRRTRHWQIASAALAVLLLGASVSLVNERVLVAERKPAAMDAAAPVQVHAPPIVPRPPFRGTPVPLDAWQVRVDTTATFERALTKFKQMDANSRSLAVGSMSRVTGTMP